VPLSEVLPVGGQIQAAFGQYRREIFGIPFALPVRKRAEKEGIRHVLWSHERRLWC